jgi:hypothetical protein
MDEIKCSPTKFGVPPPILSSYDFRLVLCRITLSHVQIDTNGGAQILGARLPGRNFFQWCLNLWAFGVGLNSSRPSGAKEF